MFDNKILTMGEKMYVLKRTFKETCFPKEYDVDLIKEFYHIDTVLKKQGILYLCNEIKNATIIEEIKS